MLSHVKRLLYAAVFWLYDLLSRRERRAVMVRIQYSVFDADVAPLLDSLQASIDDPLYICAEDVSDEAVEYIDEQYGDQVRLVTPDSVTFLRALAACRLVVLQGPHHLHGYRLFWRQGQRSCVLLYHGLITKAYRRHSEQAPPSASERLKSSLLDWYLYTGIDAQSVASEVEAFFRSSAERRHPAQFRQFGYPRYDRVTRLRGASPSSVPDHVDVDDLTADHTNVLYAPTHKDGEYRSTPLPFEDFDRAELTDALEQHDVRLFLRLHPSEEGSGIYEEYVDDETIFYAGSDRSFSSVELLPYVDVLVTDYSSIYMDFLPFDRPIVFVTDRHEEFLDVRGIAFDTERYFPGETVESMAEFLDHVEQCASEGDGHAAERAFVRRVLLPNWEESTAEKLLAFADIGTSD